MNYPFTARFTSASALVATALAAASIAITHQPVSRSYLRITVTGGTGTITFTGTLSGVAKTEVMTVTSGVLDYLSNLEYDHLSPIACTGLAGQTITIEACDQHGNPADTATSTTDYAASKKLVRDKSALMQPTAQGRIAPNLFLVTLEGGATGLELGQAFELVEENKDYQVQSNPTYRYYAGTDLVRQTEFYALEKE